MSRYVNIMAKVSPSTAARMDNVVDKMGLKSKYELVQTAVALVLKYVDPGGEPVEPAAQEQMDILRKLWGDVTHLRHEMARVKPNGGRRVEPSQIVGFYGRECLMVSVEDGVGNCTTTTNQREILESVLGKTLPSDSLSHLRELRRALGQPSLYTTLVEVIGAVKGVNDEVDNIFGELADADPRRVKLGIENKPARAKNKKKFE